MRLNWATSGKLLAVILLPASFGAGCRGVQGPATGLDQVQQIVSFAVVTCRGEEEGSEGGVSCADAYASPPPGLSGEIGYSLITIGAPSAWSFAAKSVGMLPAPSGRSRLHFHKDPAWTDDSGAYHGESRSAELLLMPCSNFREDPAYLLRPAAGETGALVDLVFLRGNGLASDIPHEEDQVAVCLKGL